MLKQTIIFLALVGMSSSALAGQLVRADRDCPSDGARAVEPDSMPKLETAVKAGDLDYLKKVVAAGQEIDLIEIINLSNLYSKMSIYRWANGLRRVRRSAAAGDPDSNAESGPASSSEQVRRDMRESASGGEHSASSSLLERPWELSGVSREALRLWLGEDMEDQIMSRPIMPRPIVSFPPFGLFIDHEPSRNRPSRRND